MHRTEVLMTAAAATAGVVRRNDGTVLEGVSVLLHFRGER